MQEAERVCTSMYNYAQCTNPTYVLFTVVAVDRIMDITCAASEAGMYLSITSLYTHP